MEYLIRLGKYGPAAEKLIDVVTKGIGAMYRPRAIRQEGEAEAAKICALERAKANSEEERKDIALAGLLNRIVILAGADSELIDRARARLALQEVQGQFNIEAIADAAVEHMPEAVSDAPVSDEWRQRFFKCAADVSEAEMQELRAKLLAGEVAQPKSFSTRTFDILHKLSRPEAEAFGRLLAISFSWPFDGPASIPDANDRG
jgi:hypothetical protein